MKPKILSLYLPQFHRVPENDKWWGDGYTDWIAVKNAKPLESNHNQPRIPLDCNYYNLLEYGTMEWQSNLMKQYCIDGMCFYHYWFKDGRKILEKPAENLLKWKNIEMPFCFCWANESWCRTWSSMKAGNTWSSLYETENTNGKKGILLEQDYGGKNEWDEHLKYVLPFFRDERYIKIDGKPVFVIYKPNDSMILFRMVRYWNRQIKEYGFEGIYFIGMENDVVGLNATCRRQPNYAIQSYLRDNKKNGVVVRKYPYEDIWKRTISESYIEDQKDYTTCAFVDFDTTPRMGDNGLIMQNVRVDLFKRYFSLLYDKSIKNGAKAIFINAWNEWGESNYLEPDETNKFGFLNAVRQTVQGEYKPEFLKSDKELLKNNNSMSSLENSNLNISRRSRLFEKWLCLKERGTDFSVYFKNNGFNNIAIYGVGKLAEHLIHELENTDINIVYGIDKNKKDNSLIKVFSLEDKLPKVDAVVITIMNQYDEIAEILDNLVEAEMIPLEEVIYSLE